MVAGFVDQTLSSVSNFLAMIAVARVSTVDQFGTTALVFMVITTTLAIVRGAIGTPLLLKSRHAAAIQQDTRHAVGAALLIGTAIGLIIASAGIVDGLLPICLPLAVALPFTLAQDVSRYWAMAAGRSRAAIVWDGTWTAGTAVILILTWITPVLTTPTSVLSVSALLAGVSWIGLGITSRITPRIRGLIGWWRTVPGKALRYGMEAGIGSMSSLLVVFGSVAVLGLDASARSSRCWDVFGPLNVIVTAIPLAIIPETLRSGFGPRNLAPSATAPPSACRACRF